LILRFKSGIIREMNIVKIRDIIRDKELRLAIDEDVSLQYGTYLLVKGAKDTFVAQALGDSRNAPSIKTDNDLVFKKLLSDQEVEDFKKLQHGEKERVCKAQSFADKLNLNARFFASRIGWEGQMSSFFFTSPAPIDFRELLKLLIKEFRGRIHLERVSDRQRTRIIGGIGSCGRIDCCQFLHFNNKKVSLDAVRDQGVMINHNSKIFGLHNKIKTCFLYELSDYKKNRRYLPHIKQEVTIKKQKGRVIGLDILNQRVKVFLENDTIEVFPVSEVDYPNKKEAPEVPELNFDKYNVDIEGVGIENLGRDETT